MKKLLSLLALAVPATAFAFDYAAHTPYKDVHAKSKEAAGIYMLTNEGVLQGYADGRFGPTRQVNRAEFLKVAMLVAAPDAELDEPATGKPTDPYCFPDVKIGDWFAEHICYAYSIGVVKGYPDGLFHPERTVQYDEALKMLTLLFDYEISAVNSAEWGEPYYRAAKDRGTDLPVTIRFNSPLTRGQVARLAAAFLAEHDNKLLEYRMAEDGIQPESSSSSSASSVSSSSVSSSMSSSASSSSSSSVAATSLYTLPPVSHFLLVGQVSDAIGEGVVRVDGENAHLRAFEVKLFQEVPAINTLDVYTDKGVKVAALRRRTNTSSPDYKQVYEVALLPDQDFPILDGEPLRLVVRANVRDPLNNGASDQLLQMRTFNVSYQTDTTNQSMNYAAPGPFPMHQTALGRMGPVRSVGPATGTLTTGTGVVVATYSFSGSAIQGYNVFVEHLLFSVSKSDNVTATNWMLTNDDGSLSINCSTGSDGVSCMQMPAAMGLVKDKGITLKLRANIAITGSASAFLQADLSKQDSVQWTDAAGHFRWIETGMLQGTATKLQR